MIELPRRSVTRFFIPLIDVMTLLFAIFLLMPIVKEAPPSSGAAASEKPEAPDQLQALTDEERQELERLRKERNEELQNRLAIRVVEIDADSGNLVYHEQGQRVEINSDTQAHELIQRDKEWARNQGRELCYVFLYPRKRTGFFTEEKEQKYRHWFKDVPYRIDNPLGGGEGEVP